jgi:hypothetical protein
MPHFETFFLVKWLHFTALSLGGGAMVVALLLSGFEEEREDLRGLSATIWKKAVAWPIRLATLFGVLLWLLRFQQQENLLRYSYFHFKLAFALARLAFSEMSPRALAAGKRGAALLALCLFLFASFVAINSGAFPLKAAPEAAPTLQAR